MPSDWFLLGLLGSGAGAALGGLGSAATGLGATGLGSALSTAGTSLSTAALPAAAGAGGAAGSAGVVPPLTSAPTALSTSTLPQSAQVIGASTPAPSPAGGGGLFSGILGSGGTGAGTGAGQGALLPSTPNPSLAELTNVPELSSATGGGLNVSAPPYPQPGGSTAIGGGLGRAGSFLSSLLPTSSQLQQGGLDLLAGHPSLGGYGAGSLLSQAGNALKARLVNTIAGGGQQQQMDPQTAAVLRYLMSQRGLS